MNKQVVHIYTDGSCYPNPGPGGYAAILIHYPSKKQRIVAGNMKNSTSNQMELTAILKSLEVLTKPCLVTVYTDSKLCIGWLQNGWKRRVVEINRLATRIEKTIKNGGHQVSFAWIPGHSNDKYNEFVNDLAIAQRKGVR